LLEICLFVGGSLTIDFSVPDIMGCVSISNDGSIPEVNYKARTEGYGPACLSLWILN